MSINGLRVLTSLSLLVGALALPAALEPAALGGDQCAAEERFTHDEMTRQVFFAVSEGLYRDGVSREVAARLAAVDADGFPVHFISGCPVCVPAYNAVRCYAEAPGLVNLKVFGETLGPGLAPELEAELLGDGLKPRLAALHDLVAAWVGRRMQSLRLNGAEREIWTARLEEMRKKGMASLQALQEGRNERVVPAAYAEMSACAVCDGANDGSARR